MRHKGIDKEETRRKVLAAAGRGFRKNGFAGIGVDGLAKAAGVTSGAFYAHFGSKGGAFEKALEVGLEEVIEGIPEYQRTHREDWIKAFAEYYLGQPHLDDLECGCAMASLTPEVVRFNKEIHGFFEDKMIHIADLVAAGLAGGSQEERVVRAWSLLSILIGGVHIVRAMKNDKAIHTVAAMIKGAAIEAAGETRAREPESS